MKPNYFVTGMLSFLFFTVVYMRFEQVRHNRQLKALEATTLRVPTNAPAWTNTTGTTFTTNGVVDIVDSRLLTNWANAKQPYATDTNRPVLSNYWTSVGRYEHFDTGFRLGYACAAAGGSRKDGQTIMDAFRQNRPDIVSNWFELHK